MFRRRLLLFTETFPPEIGGVQHVLSGLWGALPPETSRVVAPAMPGAETWDAQQRYQILRTTMRGFTYPQWRPALAALRRTVRDFRPEVIVCGKALFEGRAALAVNQESSLFAKATWDKGIRNQGIPYVVMTYAMELQTWLLGWKTRRDLLRVLARAARVVVINTHVKNLLQQYGIPEHKIVKIYPGVDGMFFQPVDGVQEFQARHGLAGRRVLVTVCRLVPRKGVDVLLRAVPAIACDMPLVCAAIVGDGPERDRLQALSRSLGIERYVRFFGTLSLDDLRRLLQSADLSVLTPRDRDGDMEGFGIAYLEAAASGLASVGSRSGGVPEAVLDGRTGLLVPPDDVPATSQAITQLLRDDTLRSRLAVSAHTRADREFRWEQRALLFRGMIESVVTEK